MMRRFTLPRKLLAHLLGLSLAFCQWAPAAEPASSALVRTLLTELSERHKEQPAMDVQITSKYEYPNEPREGEYLERGSMVTHLKSDGTRFTMGQSMFKKTPDGSIELQTTSHAVWNGERYFEWRDHVANTFELPAFTGRDEVLASNMLANPEMGLWLDGRCCSNTTIVDELLNSGQTLGGTFVTDEAFGRSVLIEARLQSGTYQVWISAARPFLLYKYSVERKQAQLDAINPHNKVIQDKNVVTISKFDQVGPYLVPIRGTIDRDVLNDRVSFVTRVALERTNITWMSDSELKNAFRPTMPILTKVRNLDDLNQEGIWDGQSVQFAINSELD